MDKKKRLEDSLRERIRINQKLVDSPDMRVNMKSPKPFKKNIERTLKLLKILEGIDDNY